MSRNRKLHIMAMDVHSDLSDVKVFIAQGRELSLIKSAQLPTQLGPLREFLEPLPKNTHVVFEEGPMASWLKRGLSLYAEKVVVCDPRRNSLIAKDDVKNDDADSRKLAQLYYTGATQEVYHTGDLDRQKLKDLVLHYHHMTDESVRLKNQIKAVYRGVGITIWDGSAYSAEKRQKWLEAAKDLTHPGILHNLYGLLDQAEEAKSKAKLKIARAAKSFGEIERFDAVPGIGLIGASTFYTIVDTPWRFKTLRKLWRYSGLAVGRRESNGKWLDRVGLLPSGNRNLRNVFFTAVQGCLKKTDENPLKAYFKNLILRGKSRAAARNATARKIAAILYGMWKNGSTYRENLV
jgi:transposase